MKIVLMVLTCTLISACSSLSLSFDNHALADFQQAIKQQNFQQAHYIANNLPSYNQHYAAVQKALPQLKQAEHQFASATLKKAQSLAAQQHWQAAIDLLTAAEKQLPMPAPHLKQQRLRLKAKLRAQNKIQLANLLGGEAEWLLKQQRAINFLKQQHLNPKARQRANQLAARQQQVGAQLVKLGREFAHQSDWQSSYYYLQLAQLLGADNFPQKSFDIARDKLQHQQRHNQAQRNRQQQQEADRRIDVYRKSLRIDDLLDARNYLDNHRQNRDLAAQRKLVADLSQQRYQRDMQRGDSAYAKGNYRLAEKTWQQLAPLYPHNRELSKKLARVEKVLASLNQLKDKGS